jgi:hypothetical protein
MKIVSRKYAYVVGVIALLVFFRPQTVFGAEHEDQLMLLINKNESICTDDWGAGEVSEYNYIRKIEYYYSYIGKELYLTFALSNININGGLHVEDTYSLKAKDIESIRIGQREFSCNDKIKRTLYWIDIDTKEKSIKNTAKWASGLSHLNRDNVSTDGFTLSWYDYETALKIKDNINEMKDSENSTLDKLIRIFSN